MRIDRAACANICGIKANGFQKTLTDDTGHCGKWGRGLCQRINDIVVMLSKGTTLDKCFDKTNKVRYVLASKATKTGGCCGTHGLFWVVKQCDQCLCTESP